MDLLLLVWLLGVPAVAVLIGVDWSEWRTWGRRRLTPSWDGGRDGRVGPPRRQGGAQRMTRGRRADRLAWGIGVGLALAIPFGGSRAIDVVGGGAHAGVALLLGVAITAAAAVVATRVPDDVKSPVVVMAVALGFIVFFIGYKWESSNTYVRVYCEYGSVSPAQSKGCRDHVTANQVDAYATPAAEQARSAVFDVEP